MAKQLPELKRAFSNHRAKLKTIQATSKFVTEPMQKLLTLDLLAFDERLDVWATAAPLHKTISLHDSQHDQP